MTADTLARDATAIYCAGMTYGTNWPVAEAMDRAIEIHRAARFAAEMLDREQVEGYAMRHVSTWTNEEKAAYARSLSVGRENAIPDAFRTKGAL